MRTISGRVDAPSVDLKLARFFASILFVMAAIIGMSATLALAGSLYLGDWRAVLVILGIGGLAWGLGWLGKVLWTGRPIPSWFLKSFFAAIFLVIPLAVVVQTKNWMEFLAAVGLFVPMLTALPALWRGQSAKPTRPKELDEFA